MNAVSFVPELTETHTFIKGERQHQKPYPVVQSQAIRHPSTDCSLLLANIDLDKVQGKGREQ